MGNRISEGKRGKRWDRRKTAGPKNIMFYLPRGISFSTPEEARASWDRNKFGLEDHKYMRAVLRVKDLILIVRQNESRSKTGVVDILTLDLRERAKERARARGEA